MQELKGLGVGQPRNRPDHPRQTLMEKVDCRTDWAKVPSLSPIVNSVNGKSQGPLLNIHFVMLWKDLR